MVRSDRIVGLLFIAVALCAIAMTFGFPSMRGLPYGPEFFPRAVAGLMFLGGLLLLLRKGPPNAPLVEALDEAGNDPQETPRLFEDRLHLLFVAFIVVGLLVYVALLEAIGFIPLTVLFSVLIIRQSGGGWIGSIVFSTLFTLVVHWGFASLLRVPLPPGLLGY